MSDVRQEFDAVLQAMGQIAARLWSAGEKDDSSTLHELRRDLTRIVDPLLTADRDAAGMEARVRALLRNAEIATAMGIGADILGQKWQTPISQQDLRAALSGPADAHPADGTGT